ncbi:VWA domain-containing protein [Methylobacillus gramineus]|uniref:vWA domain-containing protein n=1 Tax=Methylobacillus gramineus TaxID=755169 RepID=UPI001CFF9194|nr:vWA domain-containing protein [Methylobacillus gramineus]MCB5183861.1 VWA domain-containing protein [Methylobacillus gramineus]
MSFVHLWLLFLLPLSLIPLLLERQHSRSYSWLGLLPRDRLSDLLGLLLKILAALALFFMTLGVAGPVTDAQYIERIGQGAQLVLIIDRSASMDDPFSGAESSGVAGESKAGAAERLITRFVKERTNDMFGMVTFSNSAIHALPLNDNRDAILAAIRAAGGAALFQTNIGSGLTSGLAQFDKTPDSGSRAIILLSDGGGRIGANIQQKVRDWLERMNVTLYWIVLRQPGAISIFDTSFKPPEDKPLPPSIELNEFFKTLNTGYQAYEAEDPKSLAAAIEDINRKEKKPIRYMEEIPGRDYSPYCYALAACLLALLLAAKFIEVRTWH